MKYDVIVLGLGAMGSASAYQLARRGAKVLGIDQFSPPHAEGSSHGDSRITRQAIGEGDHYTPIVLRSYEIWREIEAQTGKDLLTITGGLIISGGKNKGINHVEGFFETTVAAAKKYNIEHELLTPPEVRERFPQFAIQNDEKAYFEKNAGLLRPENCIEAQLELAKKFSAQTHINEKVTAFKAKSGGVIVETEKGRYEADKLIVSAGPWVTKLFPEYAKFFSVRRQVMYWFDVKASIEPFLPSHFPVYIWELPNSKSNIYGFPAIDGPNGGVKVANELNHGAIEPDNVDRGVTQTDVDDMYNNYVKPFLPNLSARCLNNATCIYTITPDYGFVIDRLPENENIIIASPCSGHGFKHSAAIGEILADMAQVKKSQFDLSHFSIDRLL